MCVCFGNALTYKALDLCTLKPDLAPDLRTQKLRKATAWTKQGSKDEAAAAAEEDQQQKNNEGNEAANNRGRNMGCACMCVGKRVREERKCSEENGEVVSSICWKKDTREHKWGRKELGGDRQTDSTQ